jgi:hypothetical protein
MYFPRKYKNKLAQVSLRRLKILSGIRREIMNRQLVVLSAGVALSLMSSVAFAGNTANTVQLGNGGAIVVDQSASDALANATQQAGSASSEIYITQQGHGGGNPRIANAVQNAGADNVISLFQSVDGAVTAYAEQTGNRNTVSGTQNGGSSTQSITAVQDGNDNVANLTQSGGRGSADVRQTGASNRVDSYQNNGGQHIFSATQSGSNNYVSNWQVGGFTSEAYVYQEGDSNQVFTTQTVGNQGGQSNILYATQRGNDNLVRSTQEGHNVSAYITQNGNGNQSYGYQGGVGPNTVTVNQTNGPLSGLNAGINVATYHQVGSNNSATITQSR